jgi:hypothetical protein
MITSWASIQHAGRRLGAVFTSTVVLLTACSGGEATGTTGAGSVSSSGGTASTTAAGSGGGGGGGGGAATLAPILSAPSILALAVSGKTMFYTTAATHPSSDLSVYRASTEGGAPELVEQKGNDAQLRLGPDHAYWPTYENSNRTIRRMPIAGGASEIVKQGYDLVPGPFFVDGENLYHVSKIDVFHGYDIIALPLSGDAPTPVVLTGDINGEPVLLGIDATRVYFCTRELKIFDFPGFYSVLRTGGSRKKIHDADSGIEFYAATVDAKNIYFSALATYRDIQAVPLDGGAPTTIVHGVPEYSISDIASDGKDVYFADGYLLARLPVVGGAVETLFERDYSVQHVALTPESVFWVAQRATGISEIYTQAK